MTVKKGVAQNILYREFRLPCVGIMNVLKHSIAETKEASDKFDALSMIHDLHANATNPVQTKINALARATQLASEIYKGFACAFFISVL